jgi:hypothetical protein
MTTTTEQIVEQIRADLTQIEEGVILNTTVADLIRMGAPHTVQANGWGAGEQACALSAAALSAKAMGFIE